jgi:C-terminal processing protease CtpA/Prc
MHLKILNSIQKSQALKACLILVFFLPSFSFSQEIDKTTCKYLSTYGQVWGFLKYYHPKPSKMDWDKVLLDNYSDLREINTNSEFDSELRELVSYCNEIKIQKDVISIPDSLQLDSFDWMESEIIDLQIKTQLRFILKNKRKFKNTYVSKNPKVENPIFNNEKPYKDTTSISEAVKYLSVTRYWNAINYYFPYKLLIKSSWNQQFLDFIPRFISSKNYEEYYYVIREMAAKLKDGHAAITSVKFNPYDEFKCPPFWCKKVKEGTYVSVIRDSSFCNTYDVKKGDQVVGIDNSSIRKCWRILEKTMANSNSNYVYRTSYCLLATKNDSTEFLLIRDGDTIKRNVRNFPYERFKSKPVKRKEPYHLYTKEEEIKNTIYINLERLSPKDINKDFRKTLFSTDYAIIDIRGYTQWTVHQLADILLPETTIFARMTSVNYDYPGTLKWDKPEKTGRKNKDYYHGTLILLVDSFTMSRSEFTVMALQCAKNCVTIGSMTAGSDGNISNIILPGDIESYFSGLGVYYPDYSQTQQVGIRKDIEVVLSKKALEGKDEILQKALEFITDKEDGKKL